MKSWPQRIAVNSRERDASLIDLRRILMRGLRAGLSGRAGSDEAFLEDVAQVSLVKIIDRIDSFEGRSKFESWALAIALRTAYNELRKREWKNVSLEMLQDQQVQAFDEADCSLAPDGEAERRSIVQLIRDVIETDLTKRHRDVLLCVLNGMPQEEIARQLDTNRNNAYKIFHDARKKLKQSLESRGHDKAFFFDTKDQPISNSI